VLHPALEGRATKLAKRAILLPKPGLFLHDPTQGGPQLCI
jgi:hypothetical protein